MSLALRYHLLDADSISYDSFILAAVYDNAVAEKHRVDMEQDRESATGGSRGGDVTRYTANASTWRKLNRLNAGNATTQRGEKKTRPKKRKPRRGTPEESVSHG